VSLIGNLVTGIAALLGVFLGGMLTFRNQERAWAREHRRQWRDVRLEASIAFVAATRAMLVYLSSPAAAITTAPHPRRPGEMIPYFDEVGRQLREEMEAAITKIRLVAHSLETARAAHVVVVDLRLLAVGRAAHGHDDVPDELFVRFWASQQQFLTAARAEVELAELPDPGTVSPA
jgi:hypothetical protein